MVVFSNEVCSTFIVMSSRTLLKTTYSVCHTKLHKLVRQQVSAYFSSHHLRCWLDNQQWARRRGLGSTQRQAQELISSNSLSAKTRLLSFNRTQSRVMIGLLTGHNTLGRHLHLMELTNSPLRRRSGVEEETSAHILCECEALASLRQVHLGSFLLDPEDIKSLWAIWNFSKGTGVP
jgi:hypothetical protein